MDLPVAESRWQETAMPPRSVSPPALPEAWAEVLDQVEATLRRTETAAADREQASGSPSPVATHREEVPTRWERRLQELKEGLQGWPETLRQAEQATAEVDTLLRLAEEAVRQWLSHAEVLERTLAT
jgi:hypothetical protein